LYYCSYSHIQLLAEDVGEGTGEFAGFYYCSYSPIQLLAVDVGEGTGECGLDCVLRSALKI
jgi:hypothetical protein